MVSKIWKLTLLLGFVVSVGHQILIGICVNTVAIRVHGLNHGWIGLSDAVDYRLEAHATTASPSKPNGNTKIDVRQGRNVQDNKVEKVRNDIFAFTCILLHR